MNVCDFEVAFLLQINRLQSFRSVEFLWFVNVKIIALCFVYFGFVKHP